MRLLLLLLLLLISSNNWVAVQLSDNTLASINEVALRRARLVFGWVTVCRRVNHVSKPPRSTQTGHPSVGRRNEYRPKLAVNRHTTWCTRPVFMVWQREQVSEWGLRTKKTEISAPYGPCGWGRTYLLLPTIALQITQRKLLFPGPHHWGIILNSLPDTIVCITAALTMNTFKTRVHCISSSDTDYC